MPYANPPGVLDNRTPTAPGVRDSQETNPPPYESNSPRSDSSQPLPNVSRQLAPQSPATQRPKAPTPPADPKVTLDRIASLTKPTATLEGEVVTVKNSTVPNSRLLFCSAEKSDVKQYVTTDSTGKFSINLASGTWIVYTHDAKANPVMQAKVEVNDRQVRSIRLITD
jgi:hypothetical protein